MFTKNMICSTVLVAGGLLTQMSAMAAPIVLDFEGVGALALINGFYNGGTDILGNSGVNYGIQFRSALSLIDTDVDVSGGGDFANEPSPSTVMFFSDLEVLNYAPGFDTGFSFFYSSRIASTVKVYDGLDGTGNLIGSLALAAQGFDGCTGDPTGGFCNWTAIGIAFDGLARSIDFSESLGLHTLYDDITFGSATPGGDGGGGGGGGGGNPVPEPASLALLGLGLAGFSFLRRRKT